MEQHAQTVQPVTYGNLTINNSAGASLSATTTATNSFDNDQWYFSYDWW
jgi:hypothetical protein